MPGPKTMGRVDWMSRLKVWRVILYKGAADIPAGDYPTKEEAEDALRELVARGNPGDAPPMIICQRCRKRPAEMQNPDWVPLCKECNKEIMSLPHKEKLIETQKEWDRFLGKISPEVTNLTGDIWNRMTPAERDDLRVKAKLEYSKYWIEYFPEEKRALIREFKKEQLAIPKASGNPGFTVEEAKSIGGKLGIDFKRYDVEQLRQGLNVELEHCNVTNCDPLLTGKIAQAHLNELPDYYTRLAKMEKGGNPPMYVCAYCKQEVKEGTIHHCPGADAEREARQISEGGSFEEKANALLPMPPTDGPPLPRGLQLKWPWRK